MELVQSWLDVDVDEATRSQVLALQAEGNHKELQRLLGTRIAFGTAGLRAKMEAGFARMNDVTVLQASQGLAVYVKAHVKDACTRGVVIGHDHRHHSARFAQLTALAFVQLGFRVYDLGLVHTPCVPFTIDQEHAACGVMITASHNPAADNGYKVYWANGCQIIPPHDEGIARAIDENLGIWSWDATVLAHSDLLIKTDVSARYSQQLQSLIRFQSPINVVYTAMHGVGLPYMQAAAKSLGATLVLVEQQAQPDPDFPTVAFPNPEEKGALDLAIKTAQERAVDVVIANDPDADRFTAAVRNENGEFVQLTGNQLGILFADYILGSQDHGDAIVLNSTVSSQMLGAVARKYGADFESTLTGFKWLGNRAIDLEATGVRVPFAYEEAIGYMFSIVHDKDGISAATVFIQMVSEWKRRGTSALERLESLYRDLGYYSEANSYYVTPEPSVTSAVFERIRGLGSPYPSTVGPFSVVYWRDLTVGFDSSTVDHRPLLPVSSSSQMITTELSRGTHRARITARGSGTEPKVKVYIEACASDKVSSQELALEVWRVLSQYWFEGFGLREVTP